MYIDLETEIYLQKLEGDIRSQLYWGVVPEIPIEWQPNRLGFYLSDPISLPAFLTKAKRNLLRKLKSCLIAKVEARCAKPCYTF